MTAADALSATTFDPSSRRPESAKLIEAATELAPVLAERAAIVDRERRVSDETFASIQQAGLLRAFKPKRYGGYELGLWEHARIAFELAVGCPSSAWVFSLLNEHNWFISMFPIEAQDEMWSADPSACAAASIRADASRAGARRVRGGYQVSGRFPFMSGSDHAVWGLLAAVVQPEDGENPTAYIFLVPKSELTMVDDWFVLGMRGTGSRSYMADEVFVPEHRAVAYDDLWNGRGPGVGVHRDWPLLTAPKSQLVAYVASAPVIGIAAGAIDAFRQVVASRPEMGTWPTVQLRFAESTSELFAAKRLMETDVCNQMAHIDRREPMPQELYLRCRRNASYVGLLVWRCVERLHSMAGAQFAGMAGMPLERAFRDSKMAVMQFGLQWETQAPGFSIWAFDNPDSQI